MTRTRETVFIIAFTFAAFVLGTTEYVIVGLLKDISVSLSISLAAPASLYPASPLHTPSERRLP